MRLERPQLGDLIAGLSVALVLVPQGIAYAELAGLPPEIGLIAGTLPLIGAALFMSSPYLQVGPTALTSLLVVGALSPLATPQTADYVQLAALLALMVGVIRIVFGLARLGIAAYFVSQPVLTGFTTGAALLIVGSQMPVVLGVSPDGGRVSTRARRAFSDPANWSWVSIGLALLVVFLIFGLKRVHRAFPAILVAVGAAWLLAEIIGFDGAVVGEMPDALPSLSLDLPWSSVGTLLVPALVVAIVGFVEPASIARTYAAADRRPWSADREFVSLGVANVVAGVSGAYPVGGSFGRSSLSRASGACTRWTGAITGLALLLALPAAGLLSDIPKVVLAAVVISAVVSLIRLRVMVEMWRVSRPQGVIAVATLIATVSLDPRIDYAVIAGVALSVAIHLWRELSVGLAVTERDDALIVAPSGVLWFGSVNRVVEMILSEIASRPACSRLIVDLVGAGRIDLTAARELADVALDAQQEGMRVEFRGVPEHARRVFDGLIAPEASRGGAEGLPTGG